LCTSGRQFCDWSADYRLFSKSRFDTDAIFGVIRRNLVEQTMPTQPIVVAMDDSILHKSGTKIPGVAYRRDPLGPPFHTNFVRAQRVLQISAALPQGHGAVPARMIPIDFIHAPTAKKPKKNAPAKDWQQYNQKQRELNIGRQGAARLHHLRSQLDTDLPGQQRPLWVVVDGRFTNSNVLKNLPERTTLIGRIRADAKLYYLPLHDDTPRRGRKRLYGEKAPTPDVLRKDPMVPWQSVKIFAAGKLHNFKVKTIAPLLWRSAGACHLLRLIVIAPLAYRPRKGSRLLYRKPAFLICTNPALPLDKIIQAYIWRWDIEVNFRDEKQLIGVGEAQVWSKQSVQNAPALAVAAYAMLLLAAAQTFGSNGIPDAIVLPKWRRIKHKPRASTSDLINHLRCELWGNALKQTNFSSFLNNSMSDKKPEKLLPQLEPAVLYALN
jgi:hypothetical protein